MKNKKELSIILSGEAGQGGINRGVSFNLYPQTAWILYICGKKYISRIWEGNNTMQRVEFYY